MKNKTLIILLVCCLTSQLFAQSNRWTNDSASGIKTTSNFSGQILVEGGYMWLYNNTGFDNSINIFQPTLQLGKNSPIVFAYNDANVGVNYFKTSSPRDAVIYSWARSHTPYSDDIADGTDGVSLRCDSNYGNAISLLDKDNETATKINIRSNGTTFFNGGNVGIGTANPLALLSVNGTIRAREVKVTNLGWADFVFDDNYYLRPLKEVEAFIQKNKHLPDVPSEKEVKEEGTNLGEMDAILLQKIEELTLYMIEMQKENERLKERVNTLEKQLEK